MPRGVPTPVRQRGAIQLDALAGVELALPVQRQMICIFGRQNLGDGGLGRQSALDQPGWGLSLQDTVLARSAGVFGSAGDKDPELRRHHVQPLALVLADPMQLAPATGTNLVVDVDHDLDPRQMRWQRTAIAAALASPRYTSLGGTLVLAGLAGGCDLFDVFQAEQHLLLGQRLRPAAKAVSLQLLDDLTQPLALVPLGKQHRLQRLDIVREVIARHQCSRSYSAAFYDDLDRPDSLRRSAANNYPGWVGVAVSRAASWT